MPNWTIQKNLVAFHRAGIMCPYTDSLGADCCTACKESSENGCENEYSGSGYAKRAFQRCCKKGIYSLNV